MKLFLTISSLIISSITFSAEIITKSKLHSVTVFARGAEIQKTASLNLQKGMQTVVFKDIPQHINSNSIQVGGKGSLSVMSVNYRTNHLTVNKEGPKIKSLRDSIQLIEESITAKNNLIAVLNTEKDLLNQNKVMSSNENNSTEELIKRAKFFRSHMTELFTEISRIQKDQKQLAEQKRKIQQQINELRGGSRLRGEIVVEVDVNSSGRQQFELSYVINNAGWTPHYNIRSASIEDPLTLDYNAKVYQNSGEDWKGVSLKLSTAQPLTNAQKPDFSVWRLKILPDAIRSDYRYSNRKSKIAPSSAGVMMEADDDAGQAFTPPPVEVLQTQMSTQFIIETKYNIPSDGKHHHVNIAKHEIPANYTYFVAPKSSLNAFLLARATDWYQYNFLPGQANVFFENTFVGSTYIDPRKASDSLDISMGIDRSLIVKRSRIADFCKVKSLGGNKTETIGIGIELLSNKSTPVSIQVVDQIPVSADSKISVELKESSGAKHEEQTGKLEWSERLKPGKKKVIQFVYEVLYPKESRIDL